MRLGCCADPAHIMPSLLRCVTSSDNTEANKGLVLGEGVISDDRKCRVRGARREG